jgi:hypothetical protein
LEVFGQSSTIASQDNADAGRRAAADDTHGAISEADKGREQPAAGEQKPAPRAQPPAPGGQPPETDNHGRPNGAGEPENGSRVGGLWPDNNTIAIVALGIVALSGVVAPAAYAGCPSSRGLGA